MGRQEEEIGENEKEREREGVCGGRGRVWRAKDGDRGGSWGQEKGRGRVTEIGRGRRHKRKGERRDSGGGMCVRRGRGRRGIRRI